MFNKKNTGRVQPPYANIQQGTALSCLTPAPQNNHSTMWIGVLNTLYFVCPYFLASFVHFWIAGGILSGTRAKHHRWHLYKWNTVLKASEDLRSQSRTKSEKIITVHLVLRYIWYKLIFYRQVQKQTESQYQRLHKILIAVKQTKWPPVSTPSLECQVPEKKYILQYSLDSKHTETLFFERHTIEAHTHKRSTLLTVLIF